MLKEPLWVIQSNLLNEDTKILMARSCVQNQLDCLFVFDVPFSLDLPKVPTDRKAIFYGSCNFINKVHHAVEWRPGVFSKENDFSFDRMKRFYGDKYLNYHGQKMSVHDFCMQPVDRSPFTNQVFIKPDNDSKSFTGNVDSERNWHIRLLSMEYPNPGQTPQNTYIIVAEPKPILAEYRFFVVEGKIISGCQYKHQGIPYIHSLVSPSVQYFANTLVQAANPAPIYVLDIAQTKHPIDAPNALSVLEINGFNSSGFYACDIHAIMTAVNQYVNSSRCPFLSLPNFISQEV